MPLVWLNRALALHARGRGCESPRVHSNNISWGDGMEKWEKIADKKSIDKTITALKNNNIDAEFVKNGETAKKRVLEMIPKGAEVMVMTSMTTESIGLAQEIDNSGKYESARKKLYSMDKNTQGAEMRRLGAAPQFVVGSVHAVTEDGQVIIASASGSQLPAYVYAAEKVIWVVGAQKLVKNVEDGIKRIYEYTLPLEDARARKAYGIGSGVNKLLIFNKEMKPGRVTLIIISEKLGF